MLTIIKWSVITTDDPLMQLGTLDSLRGWCLLMQQYNLKHVQMCVGQNHKTQLLIPAIVLVHARA